MKRFLTGTAALALAASAVSAQSADTTSDDDACKRLGETVANFEDAHLLSADLHRAIDTNDVEGCQVVLEDLDSTGGLQGYVIDAAAADEKQQSEEIDNTPYTTAAQGEALKDTDATLDNNARPETAAGSAAYAEAAEADPLIDDAGEEPRAYMSDTANTLRVEDLQGLPVYDSTGESIGDVSEVLTDAEGNIDRAVVDIGGFLGIGAHSVALPLVDIEVETIDGDTRAVADFTEDQLKDMPEYEG